VRKRIALVLALGIVLSACGALDRTVGNQHTGPEVQFAAGSSNKGEWTAWAYRTVNGQLCYEFRINDKPSDGGCGDPAKPGSLITRDPASGDPALTLVIGGTEVDGATTARLVRKDAAPVDLELVPAPGVADDIGFFAASIQNGAAVRQIELLDAAGTLLDVVIIR
jgi:hypothetical protein